MANQSFTAFRGKALLLGTTLVAILLTLWILSPLWLGSARPDTYFFTLEPDDTGPVLAIYPVPGGMKKEALSDQNLWVYPVDQQKPYLFLEEAPAEDAQIGLAYRKEEDLRPIHFYSKGFGGNDLYFVDREVLTPFEVELANGDKVKLWEAKFHVYDRRAPETLTDFLEEGDKLSREARDAAAQALGGRWLSKTDG